MRMTAVILCLTGFVATARATTFPSMDEVRATYAAIAAESATGILIDVGDVLGTRAVDGFTVRPGEVATTADNDTFLTAYGDIVRGSVRDTFPSVTEMAARSIAHRETLHATPLAVTVFRYDRIDPAAYADGRVGTWGGQAQATGTGPYLEEKLFVGVGPFNTKEVDCGYRRMVIPRDMIVTNTEIDASRFTVRFAGGDHELHVGVDEVFEIPAEAFDPGRVEVTVATPFGPVGGVGVFDITECRGGGPPEFCDLPTFTRTELVWHDALDEWREVEIPVLNVRAYAGPGEITGSSTDDCTVSLKRVLLIVDGIDFENTRTQASIRERLGPLLDAMTARGFDVITLDYVDGQAPIGVNGTNIRRFMTEELGGLLDPSADPLRDVGVLAFSMGTQTARHALVNADNMGQDHHADLFVAWDGPFAGATVPAGVQTLVHKAAPFSAKAEILQVLLNSGAARQMMLVNADYAVDPMRTSYAALAASLGLPATTRNVGVANGSATGTRQDGALGGPAQRLLADISYVATWGPFALGGAWFTARSDDPSEPLFVGLIIHPLNWQDSGYWVLDPSARFGFDMAPGGWLAIPQIIDQALGSDFGSSGHDVAVTDFVPTTSALSPAFDATYGEKCNTEHVSANPGNLEFLWGELLSWANGVTPPAPAAYSAGCGVPEPAPNQCIRKALWHDGQFIAPTFDGANCRVRPVPPGTTGSVDGSKYYASIPIANCPAGHPLTQAGCLISWFSVMGLMRWDVSVIDGKAVLSLRGDPDEPPPSTCPAGTVFHSQPAPRRRLCTVTPLPPGVEPGTVYAGSLSGTSAPILFATSGCVEGVKQGQRCYLGEAPVGVTPFVTSTHYYYVP